MVAPVAHLEGDVVSAVKTAVDTESIDRLRHEAAILARVRHPGVVEMLTAGPIDGHDDDRREADGRQADRTSSGDTAPTPFRLATRHAGTATLRSVGTLEPAEVAGVLSSVAATMADIHTLGVAHTRLDPSHVIIGPDGTTSICGWAEARASEETERDWLRSTADDVAAVGAMIGELLDRRSPQGSRRRLVFSENGSSPVAKLRAVAHQATDDDPIRRPTMRALASRLAIAAPDARLPGTAPLAPPDLADDPSPEHPGDTPETSPTEAATNGQAPERPVASPRRGLPIGRMAAAAILVTAIAAGALATVAASRSDETETAAVRISATSTVVPTTIPPTTTPPRSTTSTPTPSTTTAPTTTAPTTTAPTTTAPTTTVADAEPTTTTQAVPTTTQAPTTTTATTETPGRAVPTTTTVPSTTAPATTTTTPPTCPQPITEGPDVDGDGCGDVVVIDDNTVTIGTLVLEIGIGGSQILIGDWNCDGTDTPASFHPQTGLVAVFDAWATRETEVQARIVADHPDGVELLDPRPTPGAPSCDQLRLELRSGRVLTIDSTADQPPENQ